MLHCLQPGGPNIKYELYMFATKMVSIQMWVHNAPCFNVKSAQIQHWQIEEMLQIS